MKFQSSCVAGMPTRRSALELAFVGLCSGAGPGRSNKLSKSLVRNHRVPAFSHTQVSPAWGLRVNDALPETDDHNYRQGLFDLDLTAFPTPCRGVFPRPWGNGNGVRPHFGAWNGKRGGSALR